VKPWEIIADNLSNARLELRLHCNRGLQRRTIFIADANRDDGKRFVARLAKLATLARRRQMARNFTLPFPYYKVIDERTPQTCKDHPPRAALYCALNRKDRIKDESRRLKRNTHVLILWSAVIILPYTALLLD
jgi:hypothetical protein